MYYQNKGKFLQSNNLSILKDNIAVKFETDEKKQKNGCWKKVFN